jgi:bifunctional non-homologous end joining protein LigD
MYARSAEIRKTPGLKTGRFVVHEHHARNLHWDLRLEIDGVLKSWAVPKGPSMRPGEKRLAVAVPDHSVSYIDFEGEIAEGSYGAGQVRVWDSGTFETKTDTSMQFGKGKLDVTFHGYTMKGKFALVKVHGQGKNWLLIKGTDEYADPEWELGTVLKVERKPKAAKAGARKR